MIGVLKSRDPRLETLSFFEVVCLEKGKLLLQISGCLDKTLGDVFEMIDVGFCFDGVLSFFSTVFIKRVTHFLVL